jgi:succinate-semialdehyde dehydrogenase / glutarate-semialdehyde dehydrogenase
VENVVCRRTFNYRNNQSTMIRSINPFNQEVLAEFEELPESQLLQKIERSATAYKKWRTTSFQHRGDLLKRAALLLNQKQEKYATVISKEMGKTIVEARAEVKKCADGCVYYADRSEEFLRDEIIVTEAVKSYVAYQPTGSILAIMPWNFPFWQVFRFAAPAIMAGNTGLLKHSSNVPQCSLLIEEIFREAGFPEGVFQSLLIQNDAVEKILASDTVEGIALTGSEKAGSFVASIAGKNIKKCVLELGGSDPFIVLKSADMEKTVKIAVQSRMQNAGQSCIAAKRFIVEEKIKSDFIDRFKVAIEKLKQGDQLKEENNMGPMARVDLADELDQQLKKSIKSGARVVAGGTHDGANFKPSLLDNVVPGMAAFDEETFGPLAAVTYVRDENDAIDLANRSRYGLGASIWTTDLELGERMAREIQSGTVYVNSLMRSDARLPFGGTKKSGYGRELSRHGILEFVNAKAISVNR